MWRRVAWGVACGAMLGFASAAAYAAEDPLDAETLALLEALTSTPAEAAAPAPAWPTLGPFERVVGAARLRESLAASLDEVYEVLPTLQGSLRGRLGARRFVDDLRIDAGRSVDRLDPVAFARARIRSPSAAQGPTSWRTDVVLEGLQGPDQDGAAAEVWARARTAHRSGGAVLRLGGRTGVVGASVIGRFDLADQPTVRTSSGAEPDPTGVTQRYGVSARARVFGARDDVVQIDLGYDFDRTLQRDANLRDLHLVQGSLRLRLGEVFARVTGGFVDVDAARAQASAVVRWSPRVPPRTEFIEGETPDGEVAAQIRRTPSPQPVVEVGGFAERALEGDEGRVEGYASVSQSLGPVRVDLSGRMTAVFGSIAQSVPIGNVYLDLDARGLWRVRGPWNLFVRYARTHGEVRPEALVELVDLVEGGLHLQGRHGWLSLGGWGARAMDLAALGVSTPVREATLAGASAEGALEWSRWVVAGALHRALVDLSVPDLGEGVVARNLRGRVSVRLLLPELSGFAEVGVRTAFESTPATGPSLLPAGLEPPPYAVVDVRAGFDLGLGFRVQAWLANVLDTPYSPVGRPGRAPGVDLRVGLRYAPSL